MNNQIELSSQKTEIQEAIKSGLLPKSIDSVGKALVIAQMGQDLGLNWLDSIRNINVISGKPTISAELMRRLIFQKVPSADVVISENSSEKCTIKARRHKETEYSIFTFTIEDAKRAMLATKDSWLKYPRAMLMARCTSEMARVIFPDAIAGFSYVPEEMGGNVDQDGKLVEKDITPKQSELPLDQELKTEEILTKSQKKERMGQLPEELKGILAQTGLYTDKMFELCEVNHWDEGLIQSAAETLIEQREAQL